MEKRLDVLDKNLAVNTDVEGFVFYDVLGQQNGSLFNVSLQEATLPARD